MSLVVPLASRDVTSLSPSSNEDEIPEGLDDVLSEIRGEEEFDAAHATPEEVEEYNSSVPMTDGEKEFVGEKSKFDAVDKSVSTKTKQKQKRKQQQQQQRNM